MLSEEKIVPYHTQNLTGAKVLVLAPHPDDETLGCGGSVCIHADAGDTVKIVFLTDGSKGDSSGTAEKEAYIALRRNEAEQACKCLGVSDTEFWLYEDRSLYAALECADRFSALMAEYRPDLVYVPSPLEIHPDHRAAAFLTEKYARTCDYDFSIAFYEVSQPLVFINTLVDITPVLNRKNQAIQIYESQLRERPYGEFTLAMNRYRSLTLDNTVTHAEGFFVCEAKQIRYKGILSFFCQNIEKMQPSADNLQESNLHDKGSVSVESCHTKKIYDESATLVSVIIPTRNRPDMLKTAVESVFSQTYPNIEIIVVNDGGEDVSDMLNALNTRGNIIYIRHEENRGISAARNTALRAAKGHYIAYLDDDDVYYPDHLETLVSVLEQGKYKVAYTDSHERIQIWITDRYVTVEEKKAVSGDFDRSRLLAANYISTLNIVHQRDILTQSGLFDENLPSHEDWDLWIRFSISHDFCHIPKITAAYTRREDKTSKTLADRQEFLATLCRVHDRYRHLVNDPQIFASQRQVERKIEMQSRIDSLNPDTSVDEYNACMEYLRSDIREKELLLAKTAEEKNQHIQNLENVISDKNIFIRNIENALEERKKHISNLENIIASKENHIRNLETILKDRKQHSVNLEILLKDKEIHIGNLGNLIETKDVHIRNLDAIVEDRNRFIHNLEKKIRDKDRHIENLESRIQDTDIHITNLESEIQELKIAKHELETVIADKDRQISDIASQRDKYAFLTDAKETHIRNIEAQLADIRKSKAWRTAEVFRKMFYIQLLGRVPLMQKAALTLTREGLRAFLSKTRAYLKKNKTPVIAELMESDYDRWIKKHSLSEEKIQHIRRNISDFSYKPVISILMPVYNVDQIWLEKAIDSVRSQLYQNWELCIVDDASPKPHIRKTLEKYAKKDKRIKVTYFAKNQGMSIAYNEALRSAAGEFAGTLDHDDELTEDALYENVRLLNHNPHLDMIYSDEDKLDMQGKRCEPFFKPDFSPDLLLSMNYICHFTIFRRDILNAIGGFRAGYDGSQDYDLILRFTEKTSSDRIAHISKILYHWRKIPGSAAAATDAKNYAYVSAKKALQDYMDRNTISGEVVDGNFTGSYRIKRKIATPEKVSIIIPFRDQVRLLQNCVESIQSKTDYPSYEILLVNNQSRESATLAYLEQIHQSENIRVIDYDREFDFSDMNNVAVTNADGRYILMLNNDTEVISSEWLSAMVEHAQRKDVGAVGAKLLYPDNTIQHAGVVMGLGIASHAFKHFPVLDNGYFGQASVIRNCCAVTAACLLMRKEVFVELGGLDKDNMKIAYSDVDLCLKSVQKGYLVVYTPYALLYHHESVSRGDDNDEMLKEKHPEKYQRVINERQFMEEKWRNYIENDPYYNIHLTRRSDNFAIRLD
ncbi:MAG: glycosyltransferase [Desulfococcaceae bacterium]